MLLHPMLPHCREYPARNVEACKKFVWSMLEKNGFNRMFNSNFHGNQATEWWEKRELWLEGIVFVSTETK